MATYTRMYTSGSATATTDLGIAVMGIRNDTAATQINGTNLAYGFYSVDASGRIFVTGAIGVTASNLTAYVITQSATATLASGTQQIGGVSAFISGTAVMVPASSTGVTADSVIGADSPIVASFTYIRRDGSNSWNRWREVPSGATASATGVPMVAMMAQYAVSPQVASDGWFGVPRTDVNRVLHVGSTAAISASIAATTVTAAQGTTPWTVSGNVSANQAGTWILTAQSSAITATAFISGTATVVPATATGVSADRLAGANSQIAASFNYIKASGSDLWDRWVAVPSGATASAVSGVPVVAAFFQRDDTPTVTVGNTFFGVPRLDSNRNQIITASASWPVTLAATTVTASQNGVVWGVTASALTGRVSAEGMEAHGAAGTTNPVRLGLKAAAFNKDFSSASNITAGDASAVNWYGTRTGIPFMLGGAPDMQTVWLQPTAVSSNAKLVDVAAGTKIVVLGAGVSLASTATTGVAFKMGFPSASAATGLDTVATSTAGNLTLNTPILSHACIPAGGGITRGDGGGIVAVGGDGYDLYATWTAPTNGGLDIWVSYIRVPS